MNLTVLLNASPKKSGTTFILKAAKDLERSGRFPADTYVSPISEPYLIPRNAQNYHSSLLDECKQIVLNSEGCYEYNQVLMAKCVLKWYMPDCFKASQEEFREFTIARMVEIFSQFFGARTLIVSDPNFFNDVQMFRNSESASMLLTALNKNRIKIVPFLCLRSPADTVMSLINMHFTRNGNKNAFSDDHVLQACRRNQLIPHLQGLIDLFGSAYVTTLEIFQKDPSRVFNELPSCSCDPSVSSITPPTEIPNPGNYVETGSALGVIRNRVEKLLTTDLEFYAQLSHFIDKSDQRSIIKIDRTNFRIA